MYEPRMLDKWNRKISFNLSCLLFHYLQSVNTVTFYMFNRHRTLNSLTASYGVQDVMWWWCGHYFLYWLKKWNDTKKNVLLARNGRADRNTNTAFIKINILLEILNLLWDCYFLALFRRLNSFFSLYRSHFSFASFSCQILMIFHEIGTLKIQTIFLFLMETFKKFCFRLVFAYANT